MSSDSADRFSQVRDTSLRVITLFRMFYVKDVLEKWEVPPINEVNKKLEKIDKTVRKQEEVIEELRYAACGLQSGHRKTSGNLNTESWSEKQPDPRRCASEEVHLIAQVCMMSWS